MASAGDTLEVVTIEEQTGVSIPTTIGVLAHPTRPQTAPLAEQIAATLKAQGVTPWLFTQWDANDVKPHMAGTDMVIAIGGDGSMLRAAHVCAPYDVPVLGVNMGHLGFLTEVPGTDGWEEAIAAVLNGRYWIEERMMIQILVYRGDEMICSDEALNDAVIRRGAASRMIQLHTYIDREWTTTYNADALIISTATGSTAYALASDGPILPPELRNILIVPVAAHLSLDRPIVLSEGSTVEVMVSPGSPEAVLEADGEALVDLQSEDLVCVQASKHISRFVRLRERTYFYRSLLDRLEPRISVPPLPERRQIR